MAAYPLFPSLAGIGWPVDRTPVWKTLQQEAVSGKVLRVPLWSFPKYKYQLTIDVLRSAAQYIEYQALLGFINKVNGAGLPFWFSDPNDNLTTNQTFGIGDGVTTSFPLVRSVGGFVEPIYGIPFQNNGFQNPDGPAVAGNPGITVYFNGNIQNLGLGWLGNGVIGFNSPPPQGTVISWSGNFFWLCYFDDDDKTTISNFMSGLFECKKLNFTTVKL